MKVARYSTLAVLTIATLVFLYTAEQRFIEEDIVGTLPWSHVGASRHSVLLRAARLPPSHPPPPPPYMKSPAVIVFCYERAHYLNETLRSLARLEGLERFAVYVSQDGSNGTVAALVKELEPLFAPNKTTGFEFWQKEHDTQALQQPAPAWIAQHYKWGLSRLFERNHSHAVIVEEDMLLSPDFLFFFESTAWLLDADPTLWCISSWNDNCYARDHDWDPKRMFRNSYFPGLGWMLKKEMWQELSPHWIDWGNWDVGIRELEEEVSKQRECICPELSRNKNIGALGTNMDVGWFNQSFTTLAWATEPVHDFGNLTYLLRDNYTAELRRKLKAATPWPVPAKGQPWKHPEPGVTYLVAFTEQEWPGVAEALNLWRVGSLRGHHRNVAVIPWKGATFLVADKEKCPYLSTEAALL